MDLINFKAEQTHEFNIEDYAYRVNKNMDKHLFLEKFIAPRPEDQITLTQDDGRVIAAACLINSLSDRQLSEILQNSSNLLYIDDETSNSLDAFQHALLRASDVSRTVFDFKLDDNFLFNFNSELYHALPTLQINHKEINEILLPVLQGQDDLLPSQRRLIEHNSLLALFSLNQD